MVKRLVGQIGAAGTATPNALDEIPYRDVSTGDLRKVTVDELKSTTGSGVFTTVVTSGAATIGGAASLDDDLTVLGNVTLGADADVSTLEIHPGTTASGTLQVQATDSSSDVKVTITNADHGQASVISIPDGGAATANFVLSEGATQTIDGILVLGADASAASLELHPATTASGTLEIAPVDSSSDVKVTISNADHGQASVVSIPDGGQATANFVLDQGAATIAGAKTFSTEPLLTDAAVGGVTAGTGVTVAHTKGQSIFTLVDHPMTVTDSGANGGHGTLEIFTFIAGYTNIESGLAVFTKFSAQGTTNADSGVTDLGVGTTAVATDNEILATTEQDICTKLDTTLDGSGDLSGTVNTAIQNTPAVFDGTSTAITVNVNAAITAATISATEIFDVSGVITINWKTQGDI